MQVGICVLGQVVVDGQINLLDIDTTAEDVGGDTDALVEILELLVALDADGLSDAVHVKS
jgi:hypothetical protein